MQVLAEQPPDTWDSFPLFQILNDYLRTDGAYTLSARRLSILPHFKTDGALTLSPDFFLICQFLKKDSCPLFQNFIYIKVILSSVKYVLVLEPHSLQTTWKMESSINTWGTHLRLKLFVTLISWNLPSPNPYTRWAAQKEQFVIWKAVS